MRRRAPGRPSANPATTARTVFGTHAPPARSQQPLGALCHARWLATPHPAIIAPTAASPPQLVPCVPTTTTVRAPPPPVGLPALLPCSRVAPTPGPGDHKKYECSLGFATAGTGSTSASDCFPAGRTVISAATTALIGSMVCNDNGSPCSSSWAPLAMDGDQTSCFQVRNGDEPMSYWSLNITAAVQVLTVDMYLASGYVRVALVAWSLCRLCPTLTP